MVAEQTNGKARRHPAASVVMEQATSPLIGLLQATGQTSQPLPIGLLQAITGKPVAQSLLGHGARALEISVGALLLEPVALICNA